MTTTNPPFRQIIKDALPQHPGPMADATLHLWRKLAPELISIIGELGFVALYSRSIKLAQVQHPWIIQEGAALTSKELFAKLQQCLHAKDAMQAAQAILLLFTIFLDTLALLIGEALTKHLLFSAWSRQPSDLPGTNFHEE